MKSSNKSLRTVKSAKPKAVAIAAVLDEEAQEESLWAALRAKRRENATKTVTPPPPATPIPPRVPIEPEERYVEARSPIGFFAIYSSPDSRFCILDLLDPDGNDLLCYSYKLRSTLHMKRKDLEPSNLVTSAVNFLKNVVAR